MKKDTLTPAEQRRYRVMAQYLANAQYIIPATKAANISLPVACAVLEMESTGRNVFGGDPTSSIPNLWKGGPVTYLRYRYYKWRRNRYGLQGVGPCQLTSKALQDEADRFGGCWKPQPNMHAGFLFIRQLVNAYGIQLGFQHYNGSGPAAVAYGYRAAQIEQKWAWRLR